MTGPSIVIWPAKSSNRAFQLCLDVLNRHLCQRFGGAALHVPGQIGPVVRHRQGRKRAFRHEQLAGDAIVRAVQFHIRGKDGFAIIMILRPDAEGIANRGIHPVAGGDQTSADPGAVFQQNRRRTGPVFQSLEAGAVKDNEALISACNLTSNFVQGLLKVC
jgi:hypothetical protein